MGTVHGWRAVGGGGGRRVSEFADEISASGEDGQKVPVQTFSKLKNFERMSGKDGSREIFPVFHNL